jgi:cell wall-associated NlpC family hydrolase
MKDASIWVQKYIGLPWKAENETNGVTCWSLIQQVYLNEFSIALPDYPHQPHEVKKIMQSIKEAIDSDWLILEAPEDGCVVTMAHKVHATHLGLYARGFVIHASQQFGAVVAQAPATLHVLGFGRIQYLRYLGHV